MMDKKQHVSFQDIIVELFRNYKITIEDSFDNNYDLLITHPNFQTYCELKFYKSSYVRLTQIKNAASHLAYFLQEQKSHSGLLIVSSYVTRTQKKEIQENTGIIVWDRSDLYNIIAPDLKEWDLLDKFEKLLLTGNIDDEFENVFENVENSRNLPFNYFEQLKQITSFKGYSKQNTGRLLCDELRNIVDGKDGWRNFEIKCEEILKYLFLQDLSGWHSQIRTDDDLSRYDLICRIVPKDDFWKSIIKAFNSRYLLLEFKNYKNPIGQNQIYSTERYLFTKALRSIAFIIARNGVNENGIVAAKGALRENGKLIIILNIDDICKMLRMKDNDENPSDYLSNILDDFLISLSR